MTDKSKTAPTLRERAEDAYDDARERAIEAYGNARQATAKAGRKAGEEVSEAPLIALSGGLALGAILAALIPVSRKEKELLGPVTDRLRDTASAAASAARDAGTERLEELGLTREAGSSAVQTVVDGALDALRTSAKAAATSVRGE